MQASAISRCLRLLTAALLLLLPIGCACSTASPTHSPDAILTETVSAQTAPDDAALPVATPADAGSPSIIQPELLADAATVIAPDSASAWGLPDECPGVCNAAPPTSPKVTANTGSGNITTYSTAPSAGGACNYGTTQVMWYAAMSVNISPNDGQAQWQEGRACGQCVEVTALTTQGPRTAVVRIMDRCPDGYCGIDLGGAATASLMPDGPGRYDGVWTFVSCAGHPEVSDGPPTLFVNAGSNPYWALVQVRNPPWPVASIEWQDASAPTKHGSFRYAPDFSENYYQVPLEVLQADGAYAVTLRLTDGTAAVLHLTSAELATPGAQYRLP